MAMVPHDVLAGERVLVNIGQVDAALQRALDRAVRAGELTKWRGKWHPLAGARFGLGPDKTCYGTVAARDTVAPA